MTDRPATNNDELSPTIELARQLIREPSVTPGDGECQNLLMRRLKALNFVCEEMPFGLVRNFWARRGKASPLFVFAGHTDVVPTGPENQWTWPPFEGVIADGFLHGRGSADMKGSLAAFMTALERFVEACPHHQGSIALLITSDEEGPAIDGTRRVIDTLQARNESIDWCLVGEPSSTEQVGDIVKNGRRGSLGATLTVRGKQGHVAYPHLADNPIHRAMPALAELSSTHWDAGNRFFPATSFQISNINAGTGATNVIPGELSVVFNFRYSTETNAEDLRGRTEAILRKHDFEFEIEWQSFGLPFLTEEGALVEAVREAVSQICGRAPQLSTSGGTSDGRFIAPTGAQVVELGPVNATIHRIDEKVSLKDLDQLSLIYEKILFHLLGEGASQA